MKKIAPAKINVFLKIVGKRGNYHELSSRFIRHEALSDEVSFEEKTQDCELELVGDFTCLKEENTITKAYFILKEAGFDEKLKDFFKTKSVHVKKNIPEFAGLGGGSSDSASFMLLCNEVLNLGINKDELAILGAKVGADVPFFIYEYESANISGIGEKVECIEEVLPNLELIFPNVKSSTARVYNTFRENFIQKESYDQELSWQKCSSKALLESFNAKKLNDLFDEAIKCYPKLQKYYEDGYFMSGSGSAMFRIKNG